MHEPSQPRSRARSRVRTWWLLLAPGERRVDRRAELLRHHEAAGVDHDVAAERGAALRGGDREHAMAGGVWLALDVVADRGDRGGRERGEVQRHELALLA